MRLVSCLLMIVLLVAAGPAGADRELDLALLDAAGDGDAAAVEALLGRGASLKARNRFGNTALLYAARSRDPESVRVLLAAGADPNLANLEGMSALNTAAYNGDEEIVRLLLDNGARPGPTIRASRRRSTPPETALSASSVCCSTPGSRSTRAPATGSPP
jgi:ankyrin repeat protein